MTPSTAPRLLGRHLKGAGGPSHACTSPMTRTSHFSWVLASGGREPPQPPHDESQFHALGAWPWSLSRKEKHLPDPQLQETTALEPVVDGQRVRAPEQSHWGTGGTALGWETGRLPLTCHVTPFLWALVSHP